MKNHLNYAALVAILVGLALAGALVTSCRKDPGVDLDPPVKTLEEAPYILYAVETRNSFETFQWTVDKNGNTDSVSEELDVMTVTIFNTFSFTVKPDNEGGSFPGVNVKSSNTGVVRAEVLSNSEFTLTYVGDGEATIKVWNGKEGGNTTVEFKVRAVRVVHPQAFRFVVDGKNVDVKCWDTFEDAKAHKQCIISLPAEEAAYEFDDLTTIHKVVFKGFVPENCSYDMVAMYSSTGMTEEWYNWLIEKGYDEDEMFTNIFPMTQPDGNERYSDGGPVSSLKGKVTYNACARGATSFAEQREWSTFRTYLKNSIYTKYFICYIELPLSTLDQLHPE